MIDIIKLIALISVIGYFIYYIVVGGMKFLSGLPALNAMILFSLIASLFFSVATSFPDPDNMEAKKVLSKVSNGFMILTGILIIYYFFK